MKALICDDDEIILKGLGTVVDWNGLGIEIAGMATDGNMGLQLLKEKKPQLLMTDIRMPHMDGLQLIEEGKRLNPDLMAIVFSGYDDFEYARKALKLGVQDYLSKPIDMQELIRLVSSCVSRFQAAREDSFNEKENLLRKLLMNGECDSREYQDLAQDFCMVMILESEAACQLFSEIAEKLRGEGIFVMSQRERRCEIAIVSPSRLSIDMQIHYCQVWIRREFERHNLSLTCAVSSVREGITQIRRCYEEAGQALKLKFIRGCNQNLFYGETKDGQGKENPGEILDIDLMTPVKNGNRRQLEESMVQLKAQLQKAGIDSYLYMQFMVANLYSSVLKELEQVGICTALVLGNPVDQYRKLMECETVHKALEVLMENLGSICDYVNSQKAGAYSPPVYKALQYIGEHYRKSNLSMEEAASIAGLSSGRFSTLFKNETGRTFTDYLLQARMEQAKELMRNPNRKIYEVAMETGYENIPYFSTAFKKYTGCSPSEYRSKCVKES